MRTNTLRSNWGTIARCGVFQDAPSFDRGIRDWKAGDLRTAREGRNLPSPKEIRLRMELSMLKADIARIGWLKGQIAKLKAG